MICLSKIEQTLEILKEEKRKSGGHCGTYPMTIAGALGITIGEARNILNHLYKEKKITVHDAQHGKLVKLK